MESFRFKFVFYTNEGNIHPVNGYNYFNSFAGIYLDEIKVYGLTYGNENAGFRLPEEPGKEAGAVPISYSLDQNYPNPFNGQTTIRFALPQAAQVRLTLYNLRSQTVAQLVDGWRAAGFHEVTWDAANLASGMYFCRIQAGDFTAIRKMMLVK